MVGNIQGGNNLGGNFPGGAGDFPGGSLIGGNFPGASFPVRGSFPRTGAIIWNFTKQRNKVNFGDFGSGRVEGQESFSNFSQKILLPRGPYN